MKVILILVNLHQISFALPENALMKAKQTSVMASQNQSSSTPDHFSIELPVIKPGTEKVVNDDFINSEADDLTQEIDDDVIEGKLTRDAYIENMSYDQYIEIFKKLYVSPTEIKKSVMIDNYLKNYPKFNTVKKIHNSK